MSETVTPKVGIFWWVADRLVASHCSLEEADAAEDWVDYPGGHADHWERWQKAGRGWLIAHDLPLVILTSEYDEHPRGRIVFDRHTGCFLLYADRRIRTKARLAAVRNAFALPGHRVVVRGDPHYR